MLSTARLTPSGLCPPSAMMRGWVDRTSKRPGQRALRNPRRRTSSEQFTFKICTAKIFDDEEYIILEADTGDHLAFDVNKFRQVNNAQEIYTQGENEIIFPMYKENIKEYRMTINEFIKMKTQEEIL